MVRAVQTPSFVSTPPSEPFARSLPYRGLQDGMSTLTQLSPPKRAIIILGILGLVSLAVMLWRKIFSNKSDEIRSGIQEWVNDNCKDLDALHKAKAVAYIWDSLKCMKHLLDSKESTQQNSDIALPFPFCSNQKDGCCEQCNKSALVLLEYLKSKIPDMKIQTSVQSPAPKTFHEAEILGYLTKKWPDLTEQERGQVVAKLGEIQSTPSYQKDPKAHILSLRLSAFNGDDILLKAVGYLSFRHKINRK